MKKVLIPTDFSDNALNAFKYALELFKYDRSDFFIMHAYRDDIYADLEETSKELEENITDVISGRSQIKLDELLKQVKSTSPNPRHTYSIISSNNSLIDECDRIVDVENIDLIVMGTRGKTNDRKLTFGSHTLQVLKYVQCPVLAISENFIGIQPRHILFPTNFLIPYKRRELKLLCELASPYRAEIDLLFITKSKKLSIRQEDNLDFLKTMLDKNKINVKTTYYKNITEGIYSYVRQNKIDLLVMVNTRHSYLENLLFQSVIDKIGLNIEIPLLVLQNITRN